MVAQFRHTEDAGLHQTPARQTEKLLRHLLSTYTIIIAEYCLVVAGTNLSFSDSSRFLTVERENEHQVEKH